MRKIKYYIRLLIIKMLPVNKKLILFTSYNGHYSDSPRRISEEVHKMTNNIDIVWLVKDEYKAQIPDYVKCISLNSYKAIFYYGTARVIVDNVYGEKETYLLSDSIFSRTIFKLKSFLKTKKVQHVYTTWHGTPLKRMGRDQISNSILDFSCPNTTMILSDRYTMDIMQHLTFDKIRMLLNGSPRNDALFSNKKDKNEIMNMLQLPIDKKIVLFAPTFRSENGAINENSIARSGINQLSEIDFEILFNALNEAFSGEWIFVCRFHYHVEEKIDWNSLQNKYPGLIYNGNKHDDITEYLLCTDILITDVSSCMFDYMLTNKPCFLYFPDYKYYNDTERGLYMSIEELPFVMAQTFTDLVKNIKVFNEDEYIHGINNFINKMGYVDNDGSTQAIANLILTENELL